METRDNAELGQPPREPDPEREQLVGVLWFGHCHNASPFDGISEEARHQWYKLADAILAAGYMPVAEHEQAMAALQARIDHLENSVISKQGAFQVAEGGRKIWMARANEAEAELAIEQHNHAATLEMAADIAAELAKAREVRGPLGALVEALRRHRCLFWTGNVLVEIEEHYVSTGPITMVLDEDDFAALEAALGQEEHDG